MPLKNVKKNDYLPPLALYHKCPENSAKLLVLSLL